MTWPACQDKLRLDVLGALLGEMPAPDAASSLGLRLGEGLAHLQGDQAGKLIGATLEHPASRFKNAVRVAAHARPTFPAGPCARETALDVGGGMCGYFSMISPVAGLRDSKLMRYSSKSCFSKRSESAQCTWR